MLLSFFQTIWHKVRLHKLLHCRECDCKTWHQVLGVNHIHSDGPALFFEYNCLHCNDSAFLSSGLLEKEALRSINLGTASKEQVMNALSNLFPPAVVRDSYDYMKNGWWPE